MCDSAARAGSFRPGEASRSFPRQCVIELRFGSYLHGLSHRQDCRCCELQAGRICYLLEFKKILIREKVVFFDQAEACGGELVDHLLLA